MDQEHITLESVNEKLLLLTRQFEELKDDLEFARRTEEALDRVEKGEYISVDSYIVRRLNGTILMSMR